MKVFRRVKPLVLTFAAWALFAGMAWGQTGKKEDEPPPRSYVTSYMMVVFLVGAALFLVTKASPRTFEVKKRQED